MNDLDAIRADYATLKPRDQVSILTDAQERLLYEAVPALLAEVARVRAENAALLTRNNRLWQEHHRLQGPPHAG